MNKWYVIKSNPDDFFKIIEKLFCLGFIFNNDKGSGRVKKFDDLIALCKADKLRSLNPSNNLLLGYYKCKAEFTNTWLDERSMNGYNLGNIEILTINEFEQQLPTIIKWN